MRPMPGWASIALLGAFVTLLVIGAGGAGAAQFHGVTPLKACLPNTFVGQAVICSFRFTNSDSFGDTVTIDSTTDLAAQDQLFTAGGAPVTGELLPKLRLIFDNSGAVPPEPPVCTGGTGSGTQADPYVGATKCTLPGEHVVLFGQDFGAGASIRSQAIGFRASGAASDYAVTRNDFDTLPNHLLADQVTFTWRSLCESRVSCPIGPQQVQSGGSTNLVDANIQITPATADNQVNTNHVLTITVNAQNGVLSDGTATASILGGPGSFVGGVNTCNYTGGAATASCTVTITSATTGATVVSATSDITAREPNTPVISAVTATRTTNTPANTAAGGSGNATKRWVDARITITPNGVNRVGTPHTFTVFVEKNDSTGWTPAAGVTIASTTNFGSITGGTCGPAGPTGADGKCTVIANSNATGTATVNASGTVTVNGVAIAVATNGYGAHDIANQKTWVDAKIAIAPDATNEVTRPHTFTVTVQKDLGNGAGFVAAANEPVTVTLSNSVGAVANPAGPVNGTTNAAGQFQVTFTSGTTGKVTGHATATLADLGTATPVVVQTNGQAGSSADAVKTFVDAYITISPPEATNPTNTNHIYTASVFVDAGQGAGYVAAPNGTSVSFQLLAGSVGSITAGNPCTTSGGSCQVTTTSSVGGNDTMRATTTVVVGGVSMTRATGTAAPGHANSADAIKHWVPPTPPQTIADDTVRTDVHDSNHVVVTSVPSGTSVHDKVFVTRTANTTASLPNPTGNVVFHRYTTIDCTGASTDETVAIAADGTAETSAFTASAPAGQSGAMSYRADYQGNGTYPARSGACEPLRIAGLTPPVADDTVRTDVHDASHKVIPPTTSLAPGKHTIHDKVFVKRTANTTATLPDPTGNVVFHRFATIDCKGPSVDQTVALGSDGTAESRAFDASVEMSYQAEYRGDANSPARTAACEPVHFQGVVPKIGVINVVKKPFPFNLKPVVTITKNPPQQLFLTEPVHNFWVNPKGILLTSPGRQPIATFTISVTNAGNVPLENVAVSDPASPDCNRTIASMAARAVVTYTCKRGQVTSPFTNTASVSGDYVAPTTLQVPFRITVTNPGAVPLHAVSLSNTGGAARSTTASRATNCDRILPGTLKPGESRSYDCVITAKVPSKSVVVAVGTDPSGRKARATSSAQIPAVHGGKVSAHDSALVDVKCYKAPCVTG